MGRPTGEKPKSPNMQYGLIYACEVSCTGEYSSPSGDGVQSTNNNENRCGYGAVLLDMAGQILMTSSNQDTQACAVHYEHAISREDRHITLTNWIT